MNAHPPISRPELEGTTDFAVRRAASVVGGLTESKAWRLFLDECKGGAVVELLRGGKVVAWQGYRRGAVGVA